MTSSLQPRRRERDFAGLAHAHLPAYPGTRHHDHHADATDAATIFIRGTAYGGDSGAGDALIRFSQVDR